MRISTVSYSMCCCKFLNICGACHVNWNFSILAVTKKQTTVFSIRIDCYAFNGKLWNRHIGTRAHAVTIHGQHWSSSIKISSRSILIDINAHTLPMFAIWFCIFLWLFVASGWYILWMDPKKSLAIVGRIDQSSSQ